MTKYLLQGNKQESETMKPTPWLRNSVELSRRISTVSQQIQEKRLTSSDRHTTSMFPIVPVPKVRVPCRTVSFLRLHLLVDQVEGVDVPGEVAEDREADVAMRRR